MTNLRVAQNRAHGKKKRVELIWRGYTDIVDPAEERFSTDILRGRLLLALRQIKKIKNLKKFSEKEEKVFL